MKSSRSSGSLSFGSALKRNTRSSVESKLRVRRGGESRTNVIVRTHLNLRSIFVEF